MESQNQLINDEYSKLLREKEVKEDETLGVVLLFIFTIHQSEISFGCSINSFFTGGNITTL